MADPRAVARDRPPNPHLRNKFFHFHAVSGKKNCKIRGWRSPWKSWIRHCNCNYYTEYAVRIICFPLLWFPLPPSKNICSDHIYLNFSSDWPKCHFYLFSLPQTKWLPFVIERTFRWCVWSITYRMEDNFFKTSLALRSDFSWTLLLLEPGLFNTQ